ncbi:GNAT family N-acetyltransferase [Streptomyces uncialis]|uniref:Acetyltransferase n=1 Tax=Streptomyces uncialis TaxID=1048205 RepID=A0A1Q4UYE4_9ACTN|nr:GNAT family N-acetyltransferase [Streptomyces uncialis]MCX4662375.1 N-acetyltransferase [Streptomyces uncialis]OKH90584.1 acetyltransferase [Streptomyces uncialis]WTE09619.1 N-acetyltransferase [Streptomyces uncialis]
MSRPTEAVTVTDVPEQQRYEARTGDTLAGFAQYIRTAELIAFVHTEVDPAFEGRGVGGALVRASLDAARAAGTSVLAVCPFYSGWIARHPEYKDLLYSGQSKVSD